MEDKEVLAMPLHEFVATCLGWKADMEKDGEWEEIQENIDRNVLKCPVHQYAVERGRCKQTVGGSIKCRVCGNYFCSDCGAHTVDVMSRVTGYMQVVSGWNTAKRQEFEDRKRYNLS